MKKSTNTATQTVDLPAEAVAKAGKGTPTGIVKGLGELSPGAILEEDAVAQMFGRCATSVKRAVDRGELPPPVRMFGKPCWTAGAILEHIVARLRAAKREAEKDAAKFSRLSP